LFCTGVVTLVTCGHLCRNVICNQSEEYTSDAVRRPWLFSCAIRGNGHMMFSPEQINTLVRLVDAEIEAEIARICAVPVVPKKYEALLTTGDVEFARQVGISLSY